MSRPRLPPPRAASARRGLSSFQRLALWTTATTYFLILVGGLVRASGAGLGCPDWPRCFGSWVPPLSASDLPPAFDPSQFNPTLMWTEYLNRLLGVTVGLLIFATLISAIRHHRRTPRIVWPTLAAFLLVGFQGWLGGVVVRQELAAWLVTAHLIVALVIVSLLLYATVYAFFAAGAAHPVHGRARRPLAWATLALMALTLGQVGLGAQVRERIDEAMLGGTARELALSTVGAYDMWHRDGALIVVAMTAIVLSIVWSRHGHERALKQAAFVMLSLVVVQLGVGLSMAYLALTPPAQVAHLTASSLLLGAQTVMFLLARWLPDAQPATSDKRPATSD
jgi:cytochrome c oxidase assembly protein subunit 15